MEGKGSSYLCFFLICLSFQLLPSRSHSQTPILRPSMRIYLPENATGPEDIAFPTYQSNNYNPNTTSFYTSVSDGRILQFVNGILTDFATTAPNRSKELCDGKTDPNLEPVCGRPMGIAYDSRSDILYIADAYYGLMSVDSNGGMAAQLATAAEGVPFRFVNAIDVDPISGIVYFTDASAVYPKSEIPTAIKSRDTTGRLLQYNPKTGNVTVLLRNLGDPVGLAVSSNGDYVIFSEHINNVTKRFWIKENELEEFAKVPAPPGNIRRNARGEFWVAMNRGSASIGQKLVGRQHGEGAGVVETLIFDVGNGLSDSMSEVHEYVNGTFYVGSLILPFVSVFF